jgi:hypothetical protein
MTTAAYQIAPLLLPSVAAGVTPTSPYVGASIRSALVECARFTDYFLTQSFPIPDASLKLGSTAYGFTQKLRRLRTGYNDVRTLSSVRQYLDNTAFGPLPLAVERAIQRHKMRGNEDPVPILGIGEGNRYIPWGLKQLYGDAISLHELSPVYASLEGAVDVEMEPATIEEATLADSGFELIYSMFGTFYAGDQVTVLQKIVDAMKVGAETCVMWKPFKFTDSPVESFHNQRRASLINRFPDLFMEGGLHLHTEQFRWSGISGGSAHVVWGRKVGETVDVANLFDQARALSTKESSGSEAFDRSRVVRLSQGGALFPEGLFDREHILLAAYLMVAQFRKTIGIDSETLFFKMTDREAETSDPDKELASRLFGGDIAARFYRGVPLSILMMDRLSRTLDVLHSDESYPAMEIRMLSERMGVGHGGHRA